MADAVDRFLHAASGLGHDVEVRRFPEGTRTALDAANAIGCEVAQIVKSLVFLADATPVLALTSGANRVDEAGLARVAGVRVVRRASPEEVRAATGFAVGGTPPFGHPRPIRTFLDRDLIGFARVWAAAGAPDAVFATTPDELVRAAGAEIVDLKERSAADDRMAGSERSSGTIDRAVVENDRRTKRR